jgi:hypothetical protein
VAFLLLAALLGLASFPGFAHAAPSVDTWAVPSPPRAFQPIVLQDRRRDALVIVDLGSGQRRMWRLPNTGERRWTTFEIASEGGSRQARATNDWGYDAANDRLLFVVTVAQAPESCCTDTSQYREFLEVQEMSLGDTPTVRSLPVTGDRPLAFSYFASTFDNRRNRLLLVGGTTSQRVFARDVLAFDGGQWSVLPTAGPPLERAIGQALYDSLADRVYFMGGFGPENPYVNHDRELWSWDVAGGAWQEHSVPDTLPPLRPTATTQVALDPVRQRILRFSGQELDSAPDSFGVWSWDLARDAGWTRLPAAGSLPLTRTDASVAYDATRDRMAVYGGSGNGGAYDSRRYDLFEYGPASGWSCIEQSGEARDVGLGPPVVVDGEGHRAFAFLSSRFGPAYPMSIGFGPGLGHDWEGAQGYDENQPGQREFACAGWDPVGRRAILYGGRILATEAGDVWQWKPAPWPSSQWTRLLPAGEIPRPRWGAASVYDPVRRRLVVFGGDSGGPLQDTWALSLAGPPQWTKLATRGIPPAARFCASAVYDSRRDGMIVYGGNAGSEQSPVPQRDAWFLSFADGDAGIPLDTQGAIPLGRWMHGAMYDAKRDRMLVLWGRDATGGRFDCAVLELAPTPTWHEYTPAGPAPPSRWGATVVYDDVADRALILGGATSVYGDPAKNWLLEFAPGPDVLPPTGRPLALLGSTPNPTLGALDTAFDLPAATVVTARIYDAHGRLVRDLGTRTYGPGRHTFHWDGVGADGYRPRAGVYFMRVALGSSETTSKLVLVR